MDHVKCFEKFGHNCKFPEKLESDSAIAGLALLIPFAIVSGSCILTTLYTTIRRYQILQRSEFDEPEPVLSILALGFSDIQLANSVAFSMSALIFMRSTKISFSAYHYDIVCCLGLAATFTSAATMFSHRPSVRTSCITRARTLLAVLSVGLLGYLLGLRWFREVHFPGRAPSNDAQNQSALVLQASCLLNQVFLDCHFSTDRGPIPFLSDIRAFVVLIWILVIKMAFECVWADNKYEYIDVRSSNENNINKKKFLWKRLCWETVAISMSAIWVGVALWQWADLRRWMNSSGWLKDNNERVIHSFGALFSLFSLFSLVPLLATALDALYETRRKPKLEEHELSLLPGTHPQLDSNSPGGSLLLNRPRENSFTEDVENTSAAWTVASTD